MLIARRLWWRPREILVRGVGKGTKAFWKSEANPGTHLQLEVHVTLYGPRFAILYKQRLPSGLILLSVLMERSLLSYLQGLLRERKIRHTLWERKEMSQEEDGRGLPAWWSPARRDATGRVGKGGTRPSLANEREATAGAVPGAWSRRMEKTGRTYNPFSKSHRPRDPATVVQKPRAGQDVRTAREPNLQDGNWAGISRKQ